MEVGIRLVLGMMECEMGEEWGWVMLVCGGSSSGGSSGGSSGSGNSSVCVVMGDG